LKILAGIFSPFKKTESKNMENKEEEGGSSVINAIQKLSLKGRFAFFLSLILFVLGENSKSLEEWTNREVKEWFLKGRYAKYAHLFENFDGKVLAQFTKEDLQKTTEIGSLWGAALFNALQELKKGFKVL
jgi:hypothetical protein